VLILQGPEQVVEALTFSPDATTLYFVQGIQGIRAWNIADRTATRAECEGRLLIGQFVFHPGGRWAFSSTAHTTPPNHNTAHILDLSAGTMRPINFIGNVRNSIAFVSGGARLVTIGYSAFDTERPANPPRWRLYGWTMTPEGPVYAWHRDAPLNEGVLSLVGLGDRVVTADVVAPAGYIYASTSRHIRVTIRRASDGEPEVQLPFPHPEIQQILAAPGGDLLVGRLGTELHVWSASDWNAPPVVVEGRHTPTMRPPAAAFHPSGRYLLLANDGPSIVAFDTTTWKQVQKWKWSSGRLGVIAVSPDGTLAAAGSTHGVVVVWDLDL
jgi:hypothetical protein